MSKKQRIEGIVTRNVTLNDDAVMNKDERRIKVSFSSEAKVKRASFFEEPWIEVLGHRDDEVDLSRLNAGAPVLYNHDRSQRDNRIGVVERAWVDNGKGHAELRISKRDDVSGIWDDIENGILRNVSVGYRINERTLAAQHKNGPDEYRVNQWTPMEISLVDIPADSSVGIGRDDNEAMTYRVVDIQPQPEASGDQRKGDASMTMQIETSAAKAESMVVDEKVIRAEAASKALKTEKTRRMELRQVFSPFGDEHRGLCDQCLDDPDITADEARTMLLNAIGKTSSQEGSIGDNARVEVLEDARDKFRHGASLAIQARSGLAEDDSKNEFRGLTLVELARRSLEISGVSTRNMERMDMIGRAFTHSTSDFTAILANTAEKSLLKGYTETDETFPLWTSAGTLSDFKINSRVDLNEFPSLQEVLEGAEYKSATIGERAETIQLATYGSMFSITRQAIINDDLSVFTRIPRKMGRAAIRTIGNLVYAVLTDNPLSGDGLPLFDAGHNNLAASGGAPTVATLDAARVAMATQKIGEATLNIRPTYFLVPVALEGTAKVLMASETDPSQNNSRKPNSVRGLSQVISDARLDAASTTAWYLTANASQFDVLEVAYLDGRSTPTLEQQSGWHVDGIEYKVRLDAGVKALDYRTFYKNAGA